MVKRAASRRPVKAASLSTAEAARRLGVSVPTVQRWVDAGHLNAWKTAGGHRRVEALGVLRMLEAQRASGVAEAEAAPQQISVLIVDDNPDDRDLISALVEAALPEAAVAAVDSGFDALVRMGRAMPQVLITDLAMPHINGVEMLWHLATHAAERPPFMMAVSSRSRQQLAKLGELPPEVSFMAKPLNPTQFVATLRAWAAGTRDAAA